MSYLGTVLGLDEGARLTGIGIQPLAREITDSDGYAFAHIVRMSHGDDASEAGSAVTVFLTTAIACLSGNEPDGDTWFGIVQYAPSHFDAELAECTADAAISRALGLTRVSDSDVSSVAFTAGELREAYPAAGAGDVVLERSGPRCWAPHRVDERRSTGSCRVVKSPHADRGRLGRTPPAATAGCASCVGCDLRGARTWLSTDDPCGSPGARSTCG